MRAAAERPGCQTRGGGVVVARGVRIAVTATPAHTATVTPMNAYDFGPSGPPVMIRHAMTMIITTPIAASIRGVLRTRVPLETGGQPCPIEPRFPAR